MRKLIKKLFSRKKEIKKYPEVKKYPTTRQVMALCEKEYPGQTLGGRGNGIYHIGNGIFTSLKGWMKFQNDLLNRALNETI